MAGLASERADCEKARSAGGGDMKGPAQDLIVVDMSRALAGPHAAMMLGDLGARVIKVESPEAGDDARNWGPPFVAGSDGEEHSTYFLSCNRNKESIALDLKSDEGKCVLRALVQRADVLIENFRPGVLDRMGFSAEELHRENPRLVILSISGFGHDGPERDRAGYDQIVQGEAGLMSVTGTGEGQLVRVGVPIADLLAGIYGAFGVLAAVHARARSGRGQVVRTSLLAAIVGVHAFQGTRFTVAGEVPGPTGVHHPSICPYGLFEAEDGPIQIAVGTDAMWSRFAAEFGLARPEWASNRKRVADRMEVDAAVQAALGRITTDYLLPRLDQLGIPAGRVRNLKQVYEWEQTRSQHLVVEVDHPTLGVIRLPGPAVRFDDQPGPHSPPPLLDEDGSAIRTWLGFDASPAGHLAHGQARKHSTI
jgi:crotonobetainyl-CoA:carnitine CoA-transferase CaiB-like acyl-CoA transferase